MNTTQRKTWKDLDLKERLIYYDRADYLLSKGYVIGDVWDWAERLYKSEKQQ